MQDSQKKKTRKGHHIKCLRNCNDVASRHQPKVVYN